jgi:ribosome-associated protein
MANSASKRRKPRSDSLVELEKVVLAALSDMKAVNLKLLDVRGLTDVADTMIIASGTSDRHVRAIADHVALQCKQQGNRARGVEGMRDGEWVLVDLQDVLVHVMLPRVREFYALEQLWEAPVAQRAGKIAPERSKRGTRRPDAARPAAGRPAGKRRSARR